MTNNINRLSSSLSRKQHYGSYIPLITLLIFLVSLVLFIGINLEGNPDSPYKKWGAPSPFDILDGSYWGLLTSNFLHIQTYHLIANLFWLWIFGKKIEFTQGRPEYVLLLFTAALVSSLATLGFSDTTGYGLSGIVYSCFGFLWAKSSEDRAYRNFIDKLTLVIFISWLFIGVLLTYLKIYELGNAAHFFGMLWGFSLAKFDTMRTVKKWIASSALFLIVSSSFLWNPFGTIWLSFQAYELHLNEEYEKARNFYERVLDRDPNNEFAKPNLLLLDKIPLYNKVNHHLGRFELKYAENISKQILKIDPDDEWAQQILNDLPKKDSLGNYILLSPDDDFDFELKSSQIMYGVEDNLDTIVPKRQIYYSDKK